MKPINEMSLAECIEALMKPTLGDFLTFNHVDRIALAARIHELTRWIPVEEILPSPQDGEPFMGRVLWMWGVGYVESKSWNNIPPKATHWRRIDI